jgi:hypothetical protein
MLLAAATYTTVPHIQPIELPHLCKLSGDYNELLNFISKVCSKCARASSHYINDQHNIHYVYGFLKGNVQNLIQHYILPNKIKLKNVESLTSMLEATFGYPDQVGTASTALDKLT